MLQEAIDLQNRAVNELVSLTSIKDVITFKSPTGSGKTFMMAKMMNALLERDDNLIFLVSSLSKGDLAEQNYLSFQEYEETKRFPKIQSYLINADVSEEEGVYIPLDYNVYVLPRDLYSKNKRLKAGAMINFLNTVVGKQANGGLGKKIYLIKDECHVETSNINELNNIGYFKKVYNFSATPNISRNQFPDVVITDEEAQRAALIKGITLGIDNDFEQAVKIFEEVKEQYRILLGVNPCLIVQISNKDEGRNEFENKIMPVLNKAEHQDLKWMYIVNQEKDCDTNDRIKLLPVKKWKARAKERNSLIDIIIFKLAISEGWDIPRACMLFQVRSVKSEQLNEQVVGRVRRNPCLLDFEKLGPEAQELALKSWVWGDVDFSVKKLIPVDLRSSDITQSEITMKTTSLADIRKKVDFDIDQFIDSISPKIATDSIFDLYRSYTASNNAIKEIGDEYIDNYSKWFNLCNNIAEIKRKYDQYVYDYAISMETTKDNDGNEKEVSFPAQSTYTDNGNYARIDNWIWQRKDGEKRFSFDSEAEQEWVEILKDLTSISLPTDPSKRLIGKTNDVFSEYFLWGKNYLSGSNIRFEYYLDGKHFSYPDFIMKDGYGRLHIFEVKSVNESNAFNFDEKSYTDKVAELVKCYKQASAITGYIFYLPIKKGSNWQIRRLMDGKEDIISEETFVEFVKTKPKITFSV